MADPLAGHDAGLRWRDLTIKVREAAERRGPTNVQNGTPNMRIRPD